MKIEKNANSLFKRRFPCQSLSSDIKAPKYVHDDRHKKKV